MSAGVDRGDERVGAVIDHVVGQVDALVGQATGRCGSLVLDRVGNRDVAALDGRTGRRRRGHLQVDGRRGERNRQGNDVVGLARLALAAVVVRLDEQVAATGLDVTQIYIFSLDV